MDTVNIAMTRGEARELYRTYKKHLHYSAPIDRECMRAYQLIAQGRLIIKALESVVKAGVGADGLPKLAICRADAMSCTVRIETRGRATMRDTRYHPRRARRGSNRDHMESRSLFEFPDGSFLGAAPVWAAEGLVPVPPVHLRPRRGLENYHILWEAEWSRTPPRDPYLLRRIGKADLWLVVAMWDLTEVERAALQTRL
jgi:hypothetical protein